jgi:hypothetical protein
MGRSRVFTTHDGLSRGGHVDRASADLIDDYESVVRNHLLRAAIGRSSAIAQRARETTRGQRTQKPNDLSTGGGVDEGDRMIRHAWTIPNSLDR